MPPSGTTGKSSSKSTGTKGAGPRSGVSGSRSPTSGSTRDSGRGPSMAASKPSKMGSGSTQKGAAQPKSTAGRIGSSATGQKVNASKLRSLDKEMVGTPRGYVKKQDVKRVDRNMKPILERATTVLGLTPLGRTATTLANAGRTVLTGASRAAPKVVEAAPSVVRKVGDATRRVATKPKTTSPVPQISNRLPSNLPNMSLRQIREMNKPNRAMDAFIKADNAIEKVAETVAGRGGARGRAETSAVIGGVLGAGKEMYDGGITETTKKAAENLGKAYSRMKSRFTGGESFKHGGLAKKKR